MELRHYRPQIEQIRRLLNGIFDKQRAAAIKVIKSGDIDNLPDDLEPYRGRINQCIMQLSHIPDDLHNEVLKEAQKSESAYNHGVATLTEAEESEAQNIVDNMKF